MHGLRRWGKDDSNLRLIHLPLGGFIADPITSVQLLGDDQFRIHVLMER